MVIPRFDRVIAGPAPAAPRVACFADLLFGPPVDPDATILYGTWGDQRLDVRVRHLRAATVVLDHALTARGLSPGDTVALVRLPRTSETLAAAAWIALVALGYRVLFPMTLDPVALPGWLTRTQSRLVLGSLTEGRARSDVQADRELLDRVDGIIAAAGLASVCLERDLNLAGRFAAASDGPPIAQAWVDTVRGRTGLDTPCTVLTTSGTGGAPRLVQYDQGAWLRSCAAWEAAGLYTPDQLGGPGLCLLLGHSMGVRALVNALWTGQPLCLLPPEWFLEHPERVAALLAEMRPTHLSGGPAVFRALLELGRAVPGIREGALRSLRRLVSIGSPFDPALAHRIEAGLGRPLDNAFGSTETLLIATTLLNAKPPSAGRPAVLGAPLPGVQLGLEALPPSGDTYRLWVASTFAARGTLDEDFGPWICTGDLVRLAVGAGASDTPGLVYAGREQEDFFKDGFGVKIDRTLFAARYANLGPPVRHIEPFALTDAPGLAAVIYVGGPRLDPARLAALTRDLRSRLEARAEALRGELDEMDFRHGLVVRFAIVPADPPRTAKGDVPRSGVLSAQDALITELIGPWRAGEGRAALDLATLGTSALSRFASPGTGALLHLARLDQSYHRAQGDHLWFRDGDGEHAVLDLVGGFGGNLLGHRHPAVLAAARRMLDEGGPPLFDQGSGQEAQGRLARKLSGMLADRTGRSWVIRFVSTGSEAVEVALAHAWLAWCRRLDRHIDSQRRTFGERAPDALRRAEAATRRVVATTTPRVFALAGAFHGHSLGARALLANPKKRAAFAPLLNLGVTWLDPNGTDDIEALEAAARLVLPILVDRDGTVAESTMEVPGYFASFAEPVQGEGGFRPVDAGLLARLARLDVPLVLDEIQCGLGRTGSFLASPVVGSAFLFAKALGGGLAKIGAVAIERSHYRVDFDEWYASTFAGDAYSCTVAAAVLNVIAQDDIPKRAARVGARLRRGLEAVVADHPTVITGVHGLGLQIGVSLRGRPERLAPRMLADRDLLGVAAAGWLLHHHHLRVLPALTAPSTLRLEPSAYLGDADNDRVVAAIRALAQVLDDGDTAALVGWLADVPPGAPEAAPPRRMPDTLDCRIEPPPEGAARVAFLHPFIRPAWDLLSAEPSLARLPAPARELLADRVESLLGGHPSIDQAHPLLGGRVWMVSLLLPLGPTTFEDATRSDARSMLIARIQEGVDRAAALGCSVVTLGAATSIVTRNGQALLAPPGVRITSGNALTAALGAARLRAAASSAGVRGGWLGILGATGNIGQALVQALIGPGQWSRAVLIGRDHARLAAIPADAPAGAEIIRSTDLRDLTRCQSIIAATATAEPLLFPEHLRTDGPVVLVDLAMPSPVADAVWALPHVRRVPAAGWVPLPDDPTALAGAHIPRGTTFCCAAEGILIGLHPQAVADVALIGALTPDALAAVERIARAEGLWPDTGDT